MSYSIWTIDRSSELFSMSLPSSTDLHMCPKKGSKVDTPIKIREE